MYRLKNMFGAIGIALGLGQFSGIAMAAPPGAPVVTLTGTQTVTLCNDPKQATDLVVNATATNLGGKAAAYTWATDIPGFNISAGNRQNTATGQAFTVPSATILQAINSAAAHSVTVPNMLRVRLYVTNDQRLSSDIVEFPFKIASCQVKR